MNYYLYSWIDSQGNRWEAVQPRTWAESMRADGFTVTLLKKLGGVR